MQEILDCFHSLAPQIAQLIAKGQTHYTESTNSSGDLQLALDLQSDALIQAHLSPIPSLLSLFSEERESPLPCHPKGRYCVAYDPIDGSSLMDANLSVGTIFGIYEGEFEARALIASGYILYGPRLEMVIARKGQRELSHERYDFDTKQWNPQAPIALQSRGKLNATGGTQRFWPPKHKAFVDTLFAQGYRLRYSGGMVPDLHQILIKGGGLFSYPATQDAPQGKLRKLFEVFPFALIFECAGGEAIDGEGRLLELGITHSHESCPCFFGSQEEIQALKSHFKEQ